jgi:hypothetical protein
LRDQESLERLKNERLKMMRENFINDQMTKIQSKKSRKRRFKSNDCENSLT